MYASGVSTINIHVLSIIFLLLPSFQADIIMALAGSNGGYWSTTFSPKSSSRPMSEGNIVTGDNETVGTASLVRDPRGKFPAIGSSSRGPESADRISNPIGKNYKLA